MPTWYDAEMVVCTEISGDTLTIIRGFFNTYVRLIEVGDWVTSPIPPGWFGQAFGGANIAAGFGVPPIGQFDLTVAQYTAQYPNYPYKVDL
jgi:hypothetical protein